MISSSWNRLAGRHAQPDPTACVFALFGAEISRQVKRAARRERW
ncbi:MAG: hypothetical protein ACK2T2_00660 [Anaerolineales bacterium]